ncbi:P-loop containing nucleoside triphosphate hydrolase protein [Bombardia bombarda]|uniref:RNA helicase n=1 Tax=Bombardia bombarda TaxID=252184 RepID=A0AA39XNT2_9PEZI|nr:P-loop containing nucleoside triphosphate hydrolase protein [Bombardia bombarda]
MKLLFGPTWERLGRGQLAFPGAGVPGLHRLQGLYSLQGLHGLRPRFSRSSSQSAPSPPPPETNKTRKSNYHMKKLRQLEYNSQTPVARNYHLFEQLVMNRFLLVLDKMGQFDAGHQEYNSFEIKSQEQLELEAGLFRNVLNKAFILAGQGNVSRTNNPLFWNLRNAFVKEDSAGLIRELKYAFQTFVLRNRFNPATIDLHLGLADLRYPYEWFPQARMMQRTIHLHVGPTNSGKTYNALKALENAKTGIYAGPLRLLAHEVYTRFTAKGLPCALITGEEQRIPEGAETFFSACTVEMAPLNRRVDVAVIDEIQMIADDSRGWAWTQAFLGIQAKELHLCGEERTVELIEALCTRIGDKCVVHRYKRLNELKTMGESLKGKFSLLEKGDAVVAFSRVGLHKLKAGIESATGRRCAIVYGSLPPETRAQQAALFNDPDNDYDFLVASDAIGMGLNLEIKRVIFEASTKYDGMTTRTLHMHEMKQIGGRAGRFRTALQAMTTPKEGSDAAAVGNDSTVSKKDVSKPGLVTTLDAADLRTIQSAFEQEHMPPIKAAGTKPPAHIIERFASYFPSKSPMSFIMARLREMSRVSGLFSVNSFTEFLEISESLKDIQMSVYDRCIFLTAPVAVHDPLLMNAYRGFARCIADQSSGHILDVPEIDLDIVDIDRATTRISGENYLSRLEACHKAITLYLWLSYRYVGVFRSQHLAFHIKELVEEKIQDYLEHLDFAPDADARRRKQLREMASRRLRKEEKLNISDLLEEEEAPQGGAGVWTAESDRESMWGDVEEVKTGVFYMIGM